MTYPTLTPSSRTWTPGDYANTAWVGMSGTESRVRNINAMQESALRLEYIGLSESDMLSFLTHYINSSGSYGAFTLPSAAFSGVSTASDYTLSGYLWRYEESPTVEDLACGGHNVSISLVSVIPEGAFADGVELEITVSFSAPTPTTARGATLEVQVQLKPGVATGSSPGTASGATLTITAAIIGGAATAGAAVAGMTATITASLAAGAATGQVSTLGLTQTISTSIYNGTDENFSSVSLLLHMDGANNSTTFTDSSSNVVVVTANAGFYGSPKLFTSDKKFGSASGSIPNDGYLSTPASSLFDFGGGVAFAIEFWFSVGNTSNSSAPLVSQRITSVYTPVEIIQAGTNMKWRVGNAALTGWDSQATDTGSLISANAWHHVAVTGDGTTLRLFFNGALRLSVAQPSWSAANRAIYVGRNGESGSYANLVDELRVTKGAARYTAAFTPPTAAFVNTGIGATGAAIASGITATVTVSLDPGAASV